MIHHPQHLSNLQTNSSWVWAKHLCVWYDRCSWASEFLYLLVELSRNPFSLLFSLLLGVVQYICSTASPKGANVALQHFFARAKSVNWFRLFDLSFPDLLDVWPRNIGSRKVWTHSFQSRVMYSPVHLCMTHEVLKYLRVSRLKVLFLSIIAWQRAFSFNVFQLHPMHQPSAHQESFNFIVQNCCFALMLFSCRSKTTSAWIVAVASKTLVIHTFLPLFCTLW